MTDKHETLVERLRSVKQHPYIENGNVLERPSLVNRDGPEAADRIDALEAEIAALRSKSEVSGDAVEAVAKAIYGDNELWRTGSEQHRRQMRETASRAIAALEALGQHSEPAGPRMEAVMRQAAFASTEHRYDLGQHSEGDVERENNCILGDECGNATPSDRCRELEEALERVRNGLRARQPNSNVMSPVSNERLLEIINAALLSEQEGSSE